MVRLVPVRRPLRLLPRCLPAGPRAWLSSVFSREGSERRAWARRPGPRHLEAGESLELVP